MDAESRTMIINKAIKQLRLLNPQDYPVLVHNILLFCGKEFGVLVLNGIIYHFTVLDHKMRKKRIELEEQGDTTSNVAITIYENQISEDILRKVEGDALWKINFSAKQNKNLAIQFSKSLKTNPPKITSFFIAAYLSMALDNMKSVIDFFRNTVINHYNDMQYRANSPWLCKILSVHNRKSNSIISEFMNTIENGSGWENVPTVMVELGFN